MNLEEKLIEQLKIVAEELEEKNRLVPKTVIDEAIAILKDSYSKESLIGLCEKSIDNVEIIKECGGKFKGSFEDGWRQAFRKIIEFLNAPQPPLK